MKNVNDKRLVLESSIERHLVCRKCNKVLLNKFDMCSNTLKVICLAAYRDVHWFNDTSFHSNGPFFSRNFLNSCRVNYKSIFHRRNKIIRKSQNPEPSRWAHKIYLRWTPKQKKNVLGIYFLNCDFSGSPGSLDCCARARLSFCAAENFSQIVQMQKMRFFVCVVVLLHRIAMVWQRRLQQQ